VAGDASFLIVETVVVAAVVVAAAVAVVVVIVVVVVVVVVVATARCLLNDYDQRQPCGTCTKAVRLCVHSTQILEHQSKSLRGSMILPLRIVTKNADRVRITCKIV
jgi:Na+/glutamate symporter